MANAFSTQGATPNKPIGSYPNSFLSGLNSTGNKLMPKTKALSSFLTGIQPAGQSMIPKPTPKPVVNQVKATPPVTAPATTSGMVKHTITYPQQTENTPSNAPVSPTQPTTPPNPTPTPTTYAGATQGLINKSSQPSQQYTDLTGKAEQAYTNAANFGKQVGQKILDVQTNPEYSIDTGVGLGNRISQNTGLQMKALTDTASGLGNIAGLANTQQSLQQSGLANAAGLLAPVQLPYSNQFVSPTTGESIGGGTSGSLNNAVSNVVQKLQSGQMTYNDAVSALSGYGQGGVNALQQALPQGFNIAQSNTLGAMQGSIGPAYDFADKALTNVETLMGQLPAIQNTNTPGINKITQGFSTLTGLGSEATRAVTGAVQTLRNAYASLLASSKGGTPTDYSGQAQAEIPESPTANDIAALRKNFETLGKARKDIYGNAGSTNTTNNSAFAEQW